jgi:hypothetical protein
MKKLNECERNILMQTLTDKRDNYIKYRSRTNNSFAIGFFSDKINNITKLISKLCTE